MDLLRLLDELDDHITRAPRVPLASQARIDRDRALDLLDAIREAMPLELGEARELLVERDTMLAGAAQQAEAMVAEASESAQRLVAEAQETAERLVAEATERAQALDAETQARTEAMVEEAKARSELTTAARLEALDSRVEALLARLGGAGSGDDVPDDGGLPLSMATKERILPIVRAAESAAEEIRAEARRDAERIAEEARRDAAAIREEAATDIAAYLAQLESETAEMLGRGRAVLDRPELAGAARAEVSAAES